MMAGFLDEHYSDERLAQVYPDMIVVEEKWPSTWIGVLRMGKRRGIL